MSAQVKPRIQISKPLNYVEPGVRRRAHEDVQQPGGRLGEGNGFLFNPAERGGACRRDDVAGGRLGFGEVRQDRWGGLMGRPALSWFTPCCA
jgi:hypothetical protein